MFKGKCCIRIQETCCVKITWYRVLFYRIDDFHLWSKGQIVVLKLKIDVCSKTSSVKRLERIIITDICIDKITYTSTCSYDLSLDDKKALTPDIIQIQIQTKSLYYKSTKWGGSLEETKKNRSCVTAGVARQRSLPCSKAISVEHWRPKFCSPSPVMVAFSYTIIQLCNHASYNHATNITNNTTTIELTWNFLNVLLFSLSYRCKWFFLNQISSLWWKKMGDCTQICNGVIPKLYKTWLYERNTQKEMDRKLLIFHSILRSTTS